MRYLYLYLLFASTNLVAESIEFDARVLRVIDGDSVIVENNNNEITLRLKYIDAPELNQSFGKESKSFLQKLVSHKDIHVSSSYKDRYGRSLSEIFFYENNVAIYINAKLIKSGHAWVYKNYRSNEYLMNLEKDAKFNKRGLWKEKNPLEPWVYRKNLK